MLRSTPLASVVVGLILPRSANRLLASAAGPSSAFSILPRSVELRRCNFACAWSTSAESRSTSLTSSCFSASPDSTASVSWSICACLALSFSYSSATLAVCSGVSGSPLLTLA